MKNKHQFIKFILVGGFATIINYCTFLSLLYFFNNNYYLFCSAVGFVSGVFAGFIPNKRWSFDSKGSTKSEGIKYLGIYTLSLAISILVMRLLVETLKLDPKISNVITICITTIINFIGVKIFVFKNKEK